MERLVLALSCATLLCAAQPAQADSFFFIEDMINELDMMADGLEVVVDNVEDEDLRAEIKDSLDAVIDRLTDISDSLRPPGQWYQANLKNCPQFCKQIGMVSKRSKEGAQCTSGERRFPSAAGEVNYRWGTWGGILNTNQASSVGGFCYGPGQKRDYDKTDRTVGCFCGKK